MLDESNDQAFARAVATCLALALDKMADLTNALVTWKPDAECPVHLFARQAIAMVWDFAEAVPVSGASGSWESQVDRTIAALLSVRSLPMNGQAARSDARALPLPDDSAPCIFTDPPYYDQIPYADLSDFFLEWLVRSVGDLYPDLLSATATEKAGELVVNAGHLIAGRPKDESFFREGATAALAEARRVLSDDGVAVVVFAHKETEGWESLLRALIESGWTVTASWPLETEMATRMRARKAASLQSSIHIVCRPRPDRAGTGDWRAVLAELETRVHEWLPRLSREGIEGADAIFACLGPALEVYSRYERVETAAGDPVPLSPPEDNPNAPAFLPAVWGAVAQQALRMIFEGGEAEGFEEDARLTAIWLWTLRSAAPSEAKPQAEEEAEPEEDEETPKTTKVRGLVLDYDTARKIAQPLGAHLETLGRPGGIVEVKKGVARLLPVADRRKALLGDGEHRRTVGTLFDPSEALSAGPIVPGDTTLDRLQQAMLLFADGRGDALRRLLIEPGHMQDGMFRRLAQALSSLYPPSSQEKRWVDGLLGVARQVGR